MKVALQLAKTALQDLTNSVALNECSWVSILISVFIFLLQGMGQLLGSCLYFSIVLDPAAINAIVRY